ncbi:DUF5804 family protein [Natrialbaceae archaeon GCM10025810]|uniref:DUF5804 family protein n=1 Tax=Halovalidus salilacus TaxID=3075124 RepID=UPI00361BBECA
MTRVCLLGESDCNLQYELLSRETSREALATYDLERPFENSLAVRTVSVGAAVSFLNDLQWYITRFVDEAIVQEPSVSDEEWLSRPLAEALRNGDVEPEETVEYCKIYGVEAVWPDELPGGPNAASADDSSADSADGSDVASADDAGAAGDDGAARPDDEADSDASPSPATAGSSAVRRKRLVEPLYARRTDGELPEYDLREVDDTLVVRVTEGEFSP